jgi:hypothetical protein
MAASDRFIAWCKQASIEQQLELLQAGKGRTGETSAQAGSTPSMIR